MFAASVLLVFLYDLDGAQKKEAFAAACAPTYHAVQRASLFSLLAFNCSFATVGWGCGYAGLQHVPAALGYASLLALCFVALLLLHAALRDETELVASADDAAATDKAKKTTSSSVGGLEAHLSTLAVRSSIASGFVYYHLITFRTDIDDVETVYGQAFLGLHSAAFALAITASVSAHVTWIALSTAFEGSSKMRVARCAEFLVAVINAMFWCSLFCFVAGFGLVGSVKKSTPKTTAAIAAVTLAAFVVAALAIKRPWRRWWPARRGSTGAGRRRGLQRWTTHTAPHDEAANRLADNAFWFGSFGYYGCLFLNAGGGTAAWLLVAYATCMGSSFAVGLAMVALTLLTHGAPPSRALRLVGRGLHHFAVLAFFAGFTAIGFVKDWSVRADGGGFAPDPRGAASYAYIVAGGGLALMACAGAAHVYVKRTVRQPAAAADGSSPPAAAPPTLSRKFSFSGDPGLLAVRRLELSKNQLAAAVSQASFCAGNVFFDVLFCTTSQNNALNVLYFAASTATFCLCAFVVSAASDALLAVPAAPRPAAADAAQRSACCCCRSLRGCSRWPPRA